MQHCYANLGRKVLAENKKWWWFKKYAALISRSLSISVKRGSVKKQGKIAEKKQLKKVVWLFRRAPPSFSSGSMLLQTSMPGFVCLLCREDNSVPCEHLFSDVRWSARYLHGNGSACVVVVFDTGYPTTVVNCLFGKGRVVLPNRRCPTDAGANVHRCSRLVKGNAVREYLRNSFFADALAKVNNVARIKRNPVFRNNASRINIAWTVSSRRSTPISFYVSESFRSACCFVGFSGMNWGYGSMILRMLRKPEQRYNKMPRESRNRRKDSHNAVLFSTGESA